MKNLLLNFIRNMSDDELEEWAGELLELLNMPSDPDNSFSKNMLRLKKRIEKELKQ